MRNVTHEALGLAAAAGVCAAAGTDVVVTAGCLLASIAGSRLPDADQAGSKIHRATRIERRHPVFALVGFVARLPIKLFAALATHRGATHSLLAALAITALASLAAAALSPVLVFPIGAGIAAGYVMHLVADACTPYGAPLLKPFQAGKIHLLPKHRRISTGGTGDALVCVTALCVAALTLVLSTPT